MNYPREGENILCIDPSSSHMAYCIVKPKDGVFEIAECGMIFCSDWSNGRKFLYIYDCLTYLILNNNIKYIQTEAYFAPPIANRRISGTTIIPSLNNLMRMLCAEIEKESGGGPITVTEVTTTTWRKHLGSGSIKDEKGKRDFKKPCRDRVEIILGKIIPEMVVSPTNLKPRKTTTDISDVLGIAVALGIELRYPKITASKDIFSNPHTIDVLHSLI